MRRLLSFSFLILLAVAVAPARVGADDEWPQFRGPAGQGHATTGKIPARWSETENIVWKTAVPGRGWSSPVIGNGVCWLTTAVTKAASPERKAAVVNDKFADSPIKSAMEIYDAVILRAIAIEMESGKILHDIELFRHDQPEAIHGLNSYASPTPVLHAGRLYCHFGNLGTACIDTRTAEVLWRSRVAVQHSVGPGSSPVICENRLIFPCDGIDAQFVAALDVATGHEVWRTKRPALTGSDPEAHKAFSTPLVIREGGAEQVVVVGAQWVVAYRPSDGKPIWQVRHSDCWSAAARPIFANGLIFVCTGFVIPEIVSIRTDGTGDVTATHVVWRMKKQAPTMPSPILVDDVIYSVSDKGVITCTDTVTGEVLFQKRAEGEYSASPLAADGKLLFSNREGETLVVEAGSKWVELSRNRLDGRLMASPAVWGDSLVLRTDSHLYRIGEQAASR